MQYGHRLPAIWQEEFYEISISYKNDSIVCTSFILASLLNTLCSQIRLRWILYDFLCTNYFPVSLYQRYIWCPQQHNLMHFCQVYVSWLRRTDIPSVFSCREKVIWLNNWAVKQSRMRFRRIKVHEITFRSTVSLVEWRTGSKIMLIMQNLRRNLIDQWSFCVRTSGWTEWENRKMTRILWNYADLHLLKELKSLSK